MMKTRIIFLISLLLFAVITSSFSLLYTSCNSVNSMTPPPDYDTYDQDWEKAFKKLYRLTTPGGSVWITDLVSHESEAVHSLMWEKYGEYLYSAGGDDYRTKVFECIDREDSPRPITYQLNLLRKAGFRHADLLHKNSCFAAFGAIR